jgi:hypothetical protein
MSQKEVTNSEIFEVVQALATHMDERFDEHDKRFESIEQRMVTKDYLDDKIGSLRGELVVLTRREDTKLASLVEELYSEKSISSVGRKTILGMEPFARRA